MHIFQYAAAMSHSSVAVPMLGTGAHHYTKETVVTDIVESIKIFNTDFPSQSLKKVFLVIRKNDIESLLTAQNHFPYNTSAPIDLESVEITFLGIRSEDLMKAASTLDTSFYEQTSKETGTFSFTLNVSEFTFMKLVSDICGIVASHSLSIFFLSFGHFLAFLLKISLSRFLSVPICNRSTSFHECGSNWDVTRSTVLTGMELTSGPTWVRIAVPRKSHAYSHQSRYRSKWNLSCGNTAYEARRYMYNIRLRSFNISKRI